MATAPDGPAGTAVATGPLTTERGASLRGLAYSQVPLRES
jgi:hypothetical protein